MAPDIDFVAAKWIALKLHERRQPRGLICGPRGYRRKAYTAAFRGFRAELLLYGMKPLPVAALHPRVVGLVAAKRRAALAAVVDSDDDMLARGCSMTKVLNTRWEGGS